MKLRYSSTSPYVRKVMIVAHEIGIAERLQIVPGNPWVSDTDVPQDNPLGKVPALITDDGAHLYDSPVICEYLDSLNLGRKLFPASGAARWAALRLQALGDGILDAAVTLRLETVMRPAEYRWPAWLARQEAAIGRGLDAAEVEVPQLGEDFNIGAVAMVCALGYLDFRWPEDDWRKARPRLAHWYAMKKNRPSVQATMPHD